MHITKTGRRFYEDYKKENGTRFKGLLGKPGLSGKPSNYTLDSLILFTSPTSNLKKGDVFYSNLDRRMICMDNGDEEVLGRTQKSYSVKVLSHKLKWQRTVSEIDRLTGLESTESVQDLGYFYGSFEEHGELTTNSSGLFYRKFKVITNKDVQVNDILDEEYVVTYVDKLLGVTIAYVRQT